MTCLMYEYKKTVQIMVIYASQFFQLYMKSTNGENGAAKVKKNPHCNNNM